MVEIRQTSVFSAWLLSLRDLRAKARIAGRIDRMRHGNPGDVRPVGSGVTEMRIDYGPGYRVYYVKREQVTVLLLCGGNKATQARDIRQAIRMAAELDE
jgi:putative addiction module killer protein